MKNQILLIATFCLLSSTCLGKLTDTEKENWEKLDWIVRGTVPFRNKVDRPKVELNLWWDDILIAIEGDYSLQDSLELDKIIETFNAAIPNRTIKWSKNKQATLTIILTELYKSNLYGRKFFLDYIQYSSNYLHENHQIVLNHRFSIKRISKANLFVQKESRQEPQNKLLWQAFAKMLIGNVSGGGFKIGELSVLGRQVSSLTEFDKFLFPTVYSPDFKKLYAKFLKYEYNLWEEFLYLTEEDTKNTIYYSLQIIIFLFLAYFLYRFIWIRKLEKKIRTNFARFHITGLIFFVPQIIGGLFFMAPDLIQLQHWKMTFGLIIIASISSFLVYLIIYLVLALMVYFIEHILFHRIIDFQQRQILRFFSVFFCFLLMTLPHIFLGNSLTYTISGVQIFILFLGFLLTVIPRLVYFQDLHQKEIIKKHQQAQVGKLEQLQTQFQLEAIQSRTNPHFLYNSLNTIASLAKQDADKTEDFALKLSRLLRLRLSENQAVEISLTEEIETTKLYLEIEKERFYDRLSYTINYPEESGETKIPSNILFCLAENAVKHGINGGGNKISIDIEETRQTITLSVSDNGNEFPENPVFGTGLKSLMEKLEILYPGNHELAIQNKPEKKIRITLNKNGAE